MFAKAAPSERAVAAPTPAEDPADAVYDAFAHSLSDGATAKEDLPDGKWIFRPMTAAPSPSRRSSWDRVHDHLKDLRRETWDAFLRESAQERDLRGHVRFAEHVEFLPGAQAEKELEDKQMKGAGEETWDGDDIGWRRFQRAHPGAMGIVTMSSVGTSPDGRQALLYVESSGDGSVSGHYFLFDRDSGSWKVVARRRTYIACS